MDGSQKKNIHKKKNTEQKESYPEVMLFGKGGVFFILFSVLLSIVISLKNYKLTF